MMRVVSYVRMSTGRQETSPAQQRNALAAHAKKQGYKIIKEYADLGVSGDKTAKRRGFRQMISDGAAGKFDRVLAYDVSRFGRFDSIEFGRWVSPLRDAGVDLETLEAGVEDWDDFGGRLQGMFRTEAKHSFLVDLARGTTRGLTAKAVEGRGHPGGPTPYGYTRTTTLTGKGGRYRHSTLEIDPEKAAIVKRIFKVYTSSGGSLNTVAAMLNDEGIPTAGGGTMWRKNAIQRILANEVYYGVAVWGRRQKGAYFARRGTDIVRRRRGAGMEMTSDPIRHEGAVPAIVSQRTYEEAQRLMKSRAGSSRSPQKTRALTGLVVCSKCGSRLHSDGPEFMRCPSSSSDAGANRSCTASRVGTRPLLSQLLATVSGALKEPSARRGIEDAVRRIVEPRTPKARKAGLDAVEARYKAASAEAAAGIERLALVPKELLADLTAVVSRKIAERDRLAAEIKGAKKTAPKADGDQVAAAMKKLDSLVLLAAAEKDPAALNTLLRTLSVRVSVDPSAPSSKRRVQIFLGDRSTIGCYTGPAAIPDFPLFSAEIFVGKAA